MSCLIVFNLPEIFEGVGWIEVIEAINKLLGILREVVAVVDFVIIVDDHVVEVVPVFDVMEQISR